MSYLAIFKRIIPFFLTFSVGLFIASLFVPLTAPNFNGFRRVPGKMREYRQLKVEVEDLRREKSRMKQENEELRRQLELKNSVEAVRDFDWEVQAPPLPPRVKELKMKSVEIK
ncbi:MAG: hypothetical protein ACT4O9_10995 [Blastocatellia bacterium]